MPPLTPPYVLIGLDVAPEAIDAAEILAEVLEGFPTPLSPRPFAIPTCYSVQVDPALATKQFNVIAMYLRLQDEKHQGRLRWVVQLCRKDEVDFG